MPYNQMIALLTSNSPASLDELADGIRNWFAKDSEMLMSFETAPFGIGEHIVLNWDKWYLRFYFEIHEDVAIQARDIAARLASGRPDYQAIANCTRRVRIVATDEPEPDHITQHIIATEFLQQLSGSVMYDPTRDELF
ncbi:MAG: hypothetical protein ACOYYS_01650 [Chloroflexota bacterium]